MKRSKQVPLILLGALTSLTGCSRSDLPATAQQGCYATLQDCRDDWDRSAGRPMVVEDGKVSLAKSGAASRGAPVHETSTHTVAVSRGGFGAHASGHGSGGG